MKKRKDTAGFVYKPSASCLRALRRIEKFRSIIDGTEPHINVLIHSALDKKGYFVSDKNVDVYLIWDRKYRNKAVLMRQLRKWKKNGPVTHFRVWSYNMPKRESSPPRWLHDGITMNGNWTGCSYKVGTPSWHIAGSAKLLGRVNLIK
jgi:hypothetical protein